MSKAVFSIQILLIICGLSLNGQADLPRIRVFPELTHSHTSPVLSPDGNALIFSIKNHPINVGLGKEEDIWVSEKMENNRWSKPFPISGEVNSPEEERPVTMLNQSNRLLVCRGKEKKNYVTFDFNGNSWIPNEKFQFPKTILPFQWLSFNAYHTVCLIGSGDTSDIDIYLSFIDATSNWSTPIVLKGFEKFKKIRDLSFSLDNRTIFFSAENESGYGGFDIYSATRIGDQWMNWSQPKNIGSQVNSLLDEYEPTISADGKRIFFTVSDRNAPAAIYSSVLPVAFQFEPLLAIKTSAEIFSTNKLTEGSITFYSAGRNDLSLTSINQEPLKLGLTTYLPKSNFLLLVSDKPAFFIPAIQLATREGTNIYTANLQRRTYLEEFEMESVRLQRDLTKLESYISANQNEINVALQKFEKSKAGIWPIISTFPDMDLRPIEKELKILSNAYALTLKLNEDREPTIEISFSDGANRVQFWRNEYSVQNTIQEEDTISNFQPFVNETVRYQWYANQLESVREIEKEYEKEALEKLKGLIKTEDLAFLNIWMEEFSRKLNQSARPSIFQSVTNGDWTNTLPEWPVKNQLQLPFFNEISLRVKPLIELEMKSRLKSPVTDLLSQHYYLQFLKDKIQRRFRERKEITLNMETLEVRERNKNVSLFRDTLIYEPLKITRDTQIHLIAYPFDYSELIPLQVPFFPVDSISPDIFGMMELQRILQILAEYPGLGIELAVQVSENNFKEGRALGEKRIGYINTHLEMAGIGSDRRKVYLLERAEQRTNNNFPIQVLIRFFYRS